MPATQMQELLKHELGDLLYAEQLILKMLGTLTREVNNPEMKARVEEHAAETEEQIERLKRAFEAIGEKAKAEKCDAAVGLKAEHDSFKKEEKPSKPVLEAFDLGSALRVEHYEIAGYRTAIAIAQVMGENEVVSLLNETLREEEAMASFIERNAVKALKLLAEQMEPRDVEFTADEGGSRSKAGSGTAAKSGARKSGGAAKSASSRTTAEKSSGGAGNSAASKSGGTAAKKAPASRAKSKAS
jgi:ferritin-like metal-binding protein YciE